MDIKTAYAIFGLDPSAGMEQVERQYDILLRRNMQLEREGNANEETELLFNKYTEAYKFLRGECEVRKMTRWDKVRNFLSYNIIKIVVITAVLILLFTMANAFRQGADIDVTMHFAGSIDTQISGLVKFQASLKEQLPDIKTALGSMPIQGDETNTTDVTETNKLFIDMTMGKTDIFILDRSQFAKYAVYGIFMDLGAYADAAEIPDERRSGLTLKANGEDTPKLYGIDVTKSALIYDSDILGAKKIAVVMARTKHLDEALAVLNILLPESNHYFK